MTKNSCRSRPYIRRPPSRRCAGVTVPAGRAEAGRRIAEAADLGPRRALSGEPLTPVLPASAAAQRDGAIGADHVAVIRRLFHQLPESVDIETCQHAEKQLAAKATEFRPDQLAKLARRLMDCLNPDGS